MVCVAGDIWQRKSIRPWEKVFCATINCVQFQIAISSVFPNNSKPKRKCLGFFSKKVELTSVRKKLLKDFLESVFADLTVGALLNSQLIPFLYLPSLWLDFLFKSWHSCLKPLYIFLSSCFENFVARTSQQIGLTWWYLSEQICLFANIVKKN